MDRPAALKIESQYPVIATVAVGDLIDLKISAEACIVVPKRYGAGNAPILCVETTPQPSLEL